MTVLVASSFSANAQDILVRKGGDVENVKVLEVTPAEVKYKKANNVDGPTFTEKRSNILSVKYENGEVQKFCDNSMTVEGGSLGDNSNYNRIFLGYAPTKFTTTGFNEWLHGFNVGWSRGYNVTRNKCQPLYIEPGIGMNVGLGELISTFDKMISFEVPVNITYRWNIPNTRICLSPYLGFHFKVNVYARDVDGNDYFDAEGFKNFQFGMQLGANFDFNRFYLGVGWNRDFIPFAKGTISYYSYSYNLKVITSGVRVNLGFIF